MAKTAAKLINEILSPVLAKRAGVSLALMNDWPAIVGEELAAQSRPIKVKWQKRSSEDEEFEPGTLHIATEAMAALHIQHQSDQIIDRVNAFMGYCAVKKIKLVQKPVGQNNPRKRRRPLTDQQKRKVDQITDCVEDDDLRSALQRFGENVMRAKKRG